MITAVLPVSRPKYLERVLDSLAAQTHPVDGLIVIHDGPDREFMGVRNAVMSRGFSNTLCVQSANKKTGVGIHDRRRNISNIHNQVRDILPPVPDLILQQYEAGWIFSIEDDGILPPDALERLLNHARLFPDSGMITGVELGRWGSQYVGAWMADDVNSVKQLWSLKNMAGETDSAEEIDGCGLYCALIRADEYKAHEFYSSNGLGPDVNLGLFLRQRGYQNYILWGVHVTHLTSLSGLEVEIPATDRSVQVSLTHLSGDIWQVDR